MTMKYTHSGARIHVCGVSVCVCVDQFTSVGKKKRI